MLWVICSPLRGQRPRVGLALGVPRPGVDEQPEALQTTQELRDLPRVADTGEGRDLAVAGIRATPAQLRDALQHPRGAVRQAQVHIRQRVTRAPRRCGGVLIATAARRAPARPFAPCRGGTEIRQHDHRHQLPQQARQRLTIPPREPRVDDRERRAHHALRGHRGQTIATRAIAAALVDHRRQPREDRLAALQHQRARAQRLHHTHPRQRRLTIEERQDPPHTHADPLTPRQPLKARRRKLPPTVATSSSSTAAKHSSQLANIW